MKLLSTLLIALFGLTSLSMAGEKAAPGAPGMKVEAKGDAKGDMKDAKGDMKDMKDAKGEKKAKKRKGGKKGKKEEAKTEEKKETPPAK